MSPFPVVTRMLAALAIALAATAAPAQTSVNGPYYAVPAWDQTLPTATRFLVLANFNGDAVLDRETGLVWARAPLSNAFTRLNAAEFCRVQATGRRGGWRLPTIAELASLFDPESSSLDGLPAGHPFLGVGSRAELFWSSSPYRETGTDHAGAGTVIVAGVVKVTLYSPLPDAGVQFRPWCVRGGNDAAG